MKNVILIPVLAFAAAWVAPAEAAANDHVEQPKAWQSTFRDDNLRADDFKAAPRPESFGKMRDGRTGRSSDVPELSGNAAGAGLTLVAGGLLALAGRRKRTLAS